MQIEKETPRHKGRQTATAISAGRSASCIAVPFDLIEKGCALCSRRSDRLICGQNQVIRMLERRDSERGEGRETQREGERNTCGMMTLSNSFFARSKSFPFR